jgi:hypothetical protein
MRNILADLHEALPARDGQTGIRMEIFLYKSGKLLFLLTKGKISQGACQVLLFKAFQSVSTSFR